MSSPCINYNDTITLILTEPDEYGSEQISEQANVKAVVDLTTGYAHASNQDAVTSDAMVAISATDQFVIDNYYRLEEMLVIIDLFNQNDNKVWYKVIKVALARDTQLCNDIDHIELYLKKTAEVSLQDVS